MDLPAGTILLDENFGTTVVNGTAVSTQEVFAAVEQQASPLLRALGSWAQDTQTMRAWGEQDYTPSHQRNGGLFQRDRYSTPKSFFDQMRLAYISVAEDDIVAGVAETTEALAFSGVTFFAEEADEEDVYNQIGRQINLDARLREMWRELFTVSQCYYAVSWKRQQFKVRGKTDHGNLRRRTFDLVAPQTITLLDPLKIIPVGNPYASAFYGSDTLAYIATRDETVRFTAVLNGESSDQLVSSLIVGPYTPDKEESAELQDMGVDIRSLWLLAPGKVARHSLTRPAYRRVSEVRLKSVFELLDTKHQLRQMERAHLIGGTNFIVVIKKGTDNLPAKQEEIANLQAQVKTVARVPILVGDHRLSVEIVTPKLDNTLKAERWNTVDSRLTARLYGMFQLGNYAAGASGDDSVKLVKVIARGMEARRHMLKRAIERDILKPLFEQNDSLDTPPKLQFNPRAIALDFDAAYASFLFDLRQSNDLSRETILNQFDLDQDLEAEYRLRERAGYDHIFKTQVPFSTPNPALPDEGAPDPNEDLPLDNGGGRRGGGGAAPGTGQGEAPRRRPKV